MTWYGLNSMDSGCCFALTCKFGWKMLASVGVYNRTAWEHASWKTPKRLHSLSLSLSHCCLLFIQSPTSSVADSLLLGDKFPWSIKLVSDLREGGLDSLRMSLSVCAMVKTQHILVFHPIMGILMMGISAHIRMITYVYTCVFFPSANEGAQHDQSDTEHWEVKISLYLLSKPGSWWQECLATERTASGGGSLN